MNGFINILKPSGVSSAFVVNKLKKLVYPSKIGHMGTLDPGACGVLVVGIGKGTRLFDFMLIKKKKYRAVFTFSLTTDTLDSYCPISEAKPFIYNQKAMQDALKSLIGEISQLPPKYSAKNVNGQRAYDLARKGIDFDLQEKKVHIYSFDMIERIDENSFMFDIVCSGGTYIRSLCRDLAERMGTVGYMSSLIRLSSGDFAIEDSVLIDEVDLSRHLISIESALKSLPTYEYEQEFYDKLCNGVAVYKPNIGQPFLIKCGGELFGISGQHDDEKIKVGVYLK